MKHLAQRFINRLGYDVVKTRPAAYGELFRSGRFDRLIDVGANKGQFLSLVRSCGYAGPVTAFEPLREHRSSIETHGNVDVVTSAVGERRGEIELNIYAQTDLSSTFRLNDAFGENYEAPPLTETRTVPLVDLDSVDFAGHRMFLKIDVQGSEAAVLRGATRTLRSVQALVMEVPFLQIYDEAASVGELFELTRRAGLFPARFWGNSITGFGAWVDGDVLFVRDPRSGAASPH